MIDPHDEAPLPAASTDTSAPSTKTAPLSRAPASVKAPDPPKPTLLTVEEWAAKKKTDAHWHLAACVVNHWAIGRQLTETEYDAAVEAAQKVEMR